MRRVFLLGIAILLLGVACVSPRMRFPYPDRPGVTVQFPVRGSERPPEPPRPVPCRQISRIPCDFLHCPGTGYDLVTIQCQGQAVAVKCEPNGGCTAGGA